MDTYGFCDVMSCIPLKVNRRFGGTHRLYFQVEDEAKQNFLFAVSRWFLCLAYSTI
jgi:hypothetical protein